MDALSLLTADHNRVRGLFARFAEAQEAKKTDEAAGLASTIFNELAVHTTIEEEIFYPAVHDLTSEAGGEIDEALQEHHVAKMLMEEISVLAPADSIWSAKMAVLIENVEHHATEEENELFPSVRSATDARWREATAEKMEARKAELGAPTLADKLDLTKEQLSHMATEQQIPGRSSMNHDELAATVGLE